MTNTKSTKRALLVSVMAMVICFTMLLGTTFAWFTDSETSTGNKITSGTLQVGFDYTSTYGGEYSTAENKTLFEFANWEPGYVEYRYVKISEEGSLAFNYDLRLIKATEGTLSALAGVIDVYVLDGEVELTSANRDEKLVDANKKGTLASLLSGDGVLRVNSLNDGDSAHTYTIALKMQENAGNTYQGMALGANFSIQVRAAQKAQEKDNIGNDYDEATDGVSLPGRDAAGNATDGNNNYTPDP